MCRSPPGAIEPAQTHYDLQVNCGFPYATMSGWHGLWTSVGSANAGVWLCPVAKPKIYQEGRDGVSLKRGHRQRFSFFDTMEKRKKKGVCPWDGKSFPQWMDRAWAPTPRWASQCRRRSSPSKSRRIYVDGHRKTSAREGLCGTEAEKPCQMQGPIVLSAGWETDGRLWLGPSIEKEDAESKPAPDDGPRFHPKPVASNEGIPRAGGQVMADFGVGSFGWKRAGAAPEGGRWPPANLICLGGATGRPAPGIRMSGRELADAPGAKGFRGGTS